MAKAPRPGTSRRQEEAAWIIRISLDGKMHTLRPGELSAVDVGECRRQAPMKFAQVLAVVREKADDASEYDIDITAILIWLARRQHGEPNLRYREVADAITYNSDFTPVPENDDTLDEEPDGPEA